MARWIAKKSIDRVPYQKKYDKNSYTTNCVNGNITISGIMLKLLKIGLVRVKLHRMIPLHYKLKSITLSQNASGKYYDSILFEYEKQVSNKDVERFLGLDFYMNGLYKDRNGPKV